MGCILCAGRWQSSSFPLSGWLFEMVRFTAIALLLALATNVRGDEDAFFESRVRPTGDVSGIGLLATSQEDGEATPQLWTYEKNNGRVFVSIPGHYSWTFDDPIFRIVLLRSFAWVANEPIDRFNALVPLGARIKK